MKPKWRERPSSHPPLCTAAPPACTLRRACPQLPSNSRSTEASTHPPLTATHILLHSYPSIRTHTHISRYTCTPAQAYLHLDIPQLHKHTSSSVFVYTHTHAYPLSTFVHIYTCPTATHRLASVPNPCTSPTSTGSSISNPVQAFSHMYSPVIKLSHATTFLRMQTHHIFSILSQIL